VVQHRPKTAQHHRGRNDPGLGQIIRVQGGGNRPEGRALQQLKDRGYAEKYRAGDGPIDLIGVEFSREQRNVVGFAGERG
jgi:hypothetical protein